MVFGQSRTKRTRRSKRLALLESLEKRNLLAVGDVLTPQDYQLSNAIVATLSSADPQDRFSQVVQSSLTIEAQLGPLPNASTGQGSLVPAVQGLIDSAFVDDRLLTEPDTQIPTYTEQALDNLGELLKDTAARSPSTQYAAGLTGLCFGFSLMVPLALPVCGTLALGTALDFGLELAFTATEQIIEDSDHSQETKEDLLWWVRTLDTGKDITDLTKVHGHTRALLNSPSILNRVQAGGHLTSQALDFATTHVDRQFADVIRSTDAATARMAETGLILHGMRAGFNLYGDVAVEVIQEEGSLNPEVKEDLHNLYQYPSVVVPTLDLSTSEKSMLLAGLGVDPSPRAIIQDRELIVRGNQLGNSINVDYVDGDDSLVTVNIDGVITGPYRTSSFDNIVIYGKGGNDNLTNRTAISAEIFGGIGNDIIIGGDGPDRVFGGLGDDDIRTLGGADDVRGGQGADIIYTGTGLDVVLQDDADTVVDPDIHRPARDVINARSIGAVPNGFVPALTSGSHAPNDIILNNIITFSPGETQHIDTFLVREHGASGEILGIDNDASDGLSVRIDSQHFGVGDHQVLFQTQTNGVRSNWLNHAFSIREIPLPAPIISSIILSATEAEIGDTVDATVHFSDPYGQLEILNFGYDADKDGKLDHNEIVSARANPEGTSATFRVNVGPNFALGANFFAANAWFNNRVYVTDTVRAGFELKPHSGNAPKVLSFEPSDEVIQFGLTFTLTAIAEAGNLPIDAVRFYYDTNNDGILQFGSNGDEYLGSGRDLGDGKYTRFVNGRDYAVGSNPRFFVDAEDGVQKSPYLATKVRIAPIDRIAPTVALSAFPIGNHNNSGKYVFSLIVTDNADGRGVDQDAFETGNLEVFGLHSEFGFREFDQDPVFLGLSVDTSGSVHARYELDFEGSNLRNVASLRVRSNRDEIRDNNGNYVDFRDDLGTIPVDVSDVSPPVLTLSEFSTDIQNPEGTLLRSLNLGVQATDNQSGVHAVKIETATKTTNGWTQWEESASSNVVLSPELNAIRASATNNDGFQSIAKTIFVDSTVPNLSVSNQQLVLKEGESETISISLAEAPLTDTTVGITTNNVHAVPNVNSLIFTPGNWDTPQSITVSTDDNTIPDAGNRQTELLVAVIDSEFTAQYLADRGQVVTFEITDDDGANVGPAVANIADQSLANGASSALPIIITDPDNEIHVIAPQIKSLARHLDESYDFFVTNGQDFYNALGAGERWMRGSGSWFYVLPNGDLYQSTDGTALDGNLIESLNPSYHEDFSSLYSAAEGFDKADVEVSMDFDVPTLLVNPDDDLDDSFMVTIDISDKEKSMSLTVRFDVQLTNLSPMISGLDDQVRADTNPFSIPLIVTDPEGDSTITSASGESNLHYLDRVHNFYIDPSGLNENLGGRGEKWIRSQAAGGRWYYLESTGSLFAERGNNGRLESLGSAVFEDPSLLYNGTNANSVPAMISIDNSGSQPLLNIDPSEGFDGDFFVTVAASDGTSTTDKTIRITVAVNNAPILESIPDQVRSETSAFTVPLAVTDADGDPLAIAAQAVSEAFYWDQRLMLHASSNSFLNWGGQNEKWFRSLEAGNAWMYILPNGELRAWDGTDRTASGELITALDTKWYTNWELLHNATGESPAVVSTLNGGLLVDPNESFTGRFYINTIVSDDGGAAAEQSFAVEVSSNSGASAAFAPPLAGDVNLDGQLTILDALRVLNHLNSSAGDGSLEDEYSTLDVNADGMISSLDALWVLNRLDERRWKDMVEHAFSDWQVDDDDESGGNEAEDMRELLLSSH